jgi:hypothetical protein
MRSELEERFQDFLIRIGLPLPQTNVVIEGYEVDCVWPEQRVNVELDGHATHSPTHAFELDRARDRRLEAAGARDPHYLAATRAGGRPGRGGSAAAAAARLTFLRA